MPDQDSTPQDSTLRGVRDRERTLLSTLASRSFVVILLLIAVAGGVGLLGGHTSTAVGQGKGFNLQLSYPGTARPGLDTFWELQVTHPGGFHSPITIAVTGSYFDLFETQGFYPTPAATTRDASYVYLKFTPPQHGDTFKVMYDAYIQPYIEPNHLLGQHATVALVSHGKRVASLPFTTWMLP